MLSAVDWVDARLMGTLQGGPSALSSESLTLQHTPYFLERIMRLGSVNLSRLSRSSKKCIFSCTLSAPLPLQYQETTFEIPICLRKNPLLVSRRDSCSYEKTRSDDLWAFVTFISSSSITPSERVVRKYFSEPAPLKSPSPCRSIVKKVCELCVVHIQ